ncbi:unnamed protein product [Taenia asiatica]|uniref:Phospholipid scramblase n=1 Tax=Taenia asiatica TaxID=60517 RepID=A0A0R3W7Z3_TAEAS|nr:unnamed protein product [Taenia asiatica]
MSADGTSQLGAIQKKWSGFLRELLTDADNFSVTFPSDLDSRAKMLVLCAAFLLVWTTFNSLQISLMQFYRKKNYIGTVCQPMNGK